MLSGDCCHHRSLFEGEAEKERGFGPTGLASLHVDLEAARRNVGWTGTLDRKREGILVCLAHDRCLDAAIEGRHGAVLESLNGWRARGIKERIRERKKSRKEILKECQV